MELSEKINKSKRVTVHIPVGTEIHTFLKNNGKVAEWVLLNELVKQLPKSKEDRAGKLYKTFSEQFLELYPGSELALRLIWVLISKRLMKVRDLEDHTDKEVFLKDSFFEELKKL